MSPAWQFWHRQVKNFTPHCLNAKSQGCFLPANKKNPFSSFFIHFHPSSSFSQLQCCARKISQRWGAIPPHSPSLPAAKPFGSPWEVFLIPSGSCSLSPLLPHPKSSLLWDLKISKPTVSTARGFSAHPAQSAQVAIPVGNFFPHPGRSRNPFSWSWETSLSHRCRASNISLMSNCASSDQIQRLSINCLIGPFWFPIKHPSFSL